MNATRTIIRTFEVNTNWGIDEVDGRGATAAEALADARAQAVDLYGCDAELVEIEAGGGVGLVWY